MPEGTPHAVRARIGEYVRRVSRTPDARPPEPVPHLPRKLYRVSEIAQHLGLTRQTLHNYATIGLIQEDARTPGGQRLFDESVFARLLEIRRLKGGHRLSDIRRLLESADRSEAAPFAAPAHPEAPAASAHEGRASGTNESGLPSTLDSQERP